MTDMTKQVEKLQMDFEQSLKDKEAKYEEEKEQNNFLMSEKYNLEKMYRNKEHELAQLNNELESLRVMNDMIEQNNL